MVGCCVHNLFLCCVFYVACHLDLLRAAPPHPPPREEQAAGDRGLPQAAGNLLLGGKVSRPAVNQIANPRSCHSSGGVIIRAKPPIVPEVFARRKEQLSYAEPLFCFRMCRDWARTFGFGSMPRSGGQIPSIFSCIRIEQSEKTLYNKISNCVFMPGRRSVPIRDRRDRPCTKAASSGCWIFCSRWRG